MHREQKCTKIFDFHSWEIFFVRESKGVVRVELFATMLSYCNIFSRLVSLRSIRNAFCKLAFSLWALPSFESLLVRQIRKHVIVDWFSISRRCVQPRPWLASKQRFRCRSSFFWNHSAVHLNVRTLCTNRSCFLFLSHRQSLVATKLFKQGQNFY